MPPARPGIIIQRRPDQEREQRIDSFGQTRYRALCRSCSYQRPWSPCGGDGDVIVDMLFETRVTTDFDPGIPWPATPEKLRPLYAVVIHGCGACRLRRCAPRTAIRVHVGLGRLRISKFDIVRGELCLDLTGQAHGQEVGFASAVMKINVQDSFRDLV